MSKFRVGDRVRVISQKYEKYGGEVDLIESILIKTHRRGLYIILKDVILHFLMEQDYVFMNMNWNWLKNSIGRKNQTMSKFKIGDRVRVISEQDGRYVGEVDIIESVFRPTQPLPPFPWKRNPLALAYYLKGCHLTLLDGTRLYFYEHELELVKSQDFLWMKK